MKSKAKKKGETEVSIEFFCMRIVCDLCKSSVSRAEKTDSKSCEFHSELEGKW